MIAPTRRTRIERHLQHGATKGRVRILELLQGGPQDVETLTEKALMSRRTFWQRIRELGDAVVVEHLGKGRALVGLAT